MTREAIPAGQAIAALFQITGNIDCPGGLVPPAEIMAYSGGWGRDLLPEEQEPKRLGLDRYRLLQMGFKQSSPDVLIETLETGEPYEIHGAHFQTTNGIACMGAAPRRVYNAFNKCDFIMSVRPVHDADRSWRWPTWSCRPPRSPSATASAWATARSAARSSTRSRRSANASPTWRSTWNWASA